MTKIKEENIRKCAKEKDKLKQGKKWVEENLKSIGKSKLTLEQEDKVIDEKEFETRSAIRVVQGPLEDASSHLLSAKGDLFTVGIATAMIQSVQSKIKEQSHHLKQWTRKEKNSGKENLNWPITVRCK